MRPGRGLPAEGTIEQQLTGGREEEVGPADDFGDAHGMVVGDDGEFVGREAVLPPDEEITEVATGDEGLRALERIDERDGLAIRDAEAPVRLAGFAGLASGAERSAQGGRKDRLSIILGMRGRQAAFDVLTGLVARIDRTGGVETMPDLAEPGEPLGLDIRGMRSADVGPLAPLQPEPAQVFDRRGGELRSAAAGIEVFGAIDERARRGAGRGEGERAGVTDVQIAGRGRGYPSAGHQSGLPVGMNSHFTPNSAATAAARAFTPHVSVA